MFVCQICTYCDADASKKRQNQEKNERTVSWKSDYSYSKIYWGPIETLLIFFFVLPFWERCWHAPPYLILFIFSICSYCRFILSELRRKENDFYFTTPLRHIRTHRHGSLQGSVVKKKIIVFIFLGGDYSNRIQNISLHKCWLAQARPSLPLPEGS